MAKLFNKIRKILVAEEPSMSRTINYLKYAFGEIVLVVIGILIALQVNTWNENRKSKIFEHKMLKEIRLELIKDTTDFALLEQRAEITNNAVDTIIQMIANSNNSNDSIMKYNQKFLGIQYTYRKGAYESLKSAGLDKIANDSVRLMLTNIYDWDLPRTGLLIKNAQDRTENKTDKLEKNIFKYTSFKMPIGMQSSAVPKVTNLYQNTFFIEYVINIKDNAKHSIFRLKNIKRRCATLIKLLDKELKIENPTHVLPKQKLQ